MKPVILGLISCCLLMQLVSGCRGWTSDLPPVHPNPNMDTQPKYKPYRESKWFSDKRDMRPLEEGVVAQGFLKADDHFYTGKVDGQLTTTFPSQVTVDKALLLRGQNRFNIYCTACHARSGSGDGMVGRRLPVKPTDFHTDYMRSQPVGHFFDVITNGIRSMPSYAPQIPEQDRWAIVAYIKALQLSQFPNEDWLGKQTVVQPAAAPASAKAR